MAFNLGAFAGGLASAALKTYTTVNEAQRLQAAEERDKTRFEEEQRKIELQRQAEDIARKAAIGSTGGLPIGDVTKAITSSFDPNANLSDTPNDVQQKAFQDAVAKMSPQQQALVLRPYGDKSSEAGQRLEADQRDRSKGASGIPVGLDTAVVREDAGGERYVLPYDTDEKAIVARHKQLAMASGNPVAIKAAHEAEATMLNREVAQQTLKLGEQNIAMNVFKLSEAQSVADFTKRFNDSLVAAKTENSKLLKEVDEAISDPKATVESLLKQFGVQIKDGTGQSYYAKDGKVYTKDAGGNETVVADSLDQAKVLLKQGAGAHFAHDLSNRIVKEGLFKSPEAFNDFYKAEREWVTSSANIANSRVMAAAATKNANSSAVTADAAKKKADTDAAEFEAKKNAGTYKATAEALVAQAAASRAHGEYYANLSKRANDDAVLTASTRAEVKTILQEYEKLTPAQQTGPEGEAILTKATLLYAKKSGDISGFITARKRADGTEAKPIAPADVAKFVESFGGIASSFKDPKTGEAILIGKLTPGQVMQEMQAMMGGTSPTGSGLSSNAPPPKEGPPKTADAAATPEAPKSAVQRGIPLRSTDGGKTFYLDVPDTIRDPSVKYYREIPNPAAAALNGKSFKSSAEAEAAYNAAMEAAKKAPAAPAPTTQAIPAGKPAAKPAAAAPAAAAPAAAAPAPAAAAPAAAAAAPAAPAGKSVAAQDEDLSYAAIVAQSNYDRRPGAITKAQLDKAQQALAAFRKANGIKP